MPYEFGYPGIPTNLQNRSKTRFDNDNLSQRQKLSVDVQRPRPSLEALYENEPSVEELLAQAQGTLDETAPNANVLRGTELQMHNPADDAAAREQARTAEKGSYRGVARDTARAAQLTGLGLSPFTGGASMAALSVPASVYLAADEGLEAGQDFAEGNYADAAGNAAMAALDASGTGLSKLFRRSSAAARTGAGAQGPFSAYPRPKPRQLGGSGQKLLAESNVLEGEVLPPLVPRQIGPGARPMPPAPDTSFVRGVPAEYPQSIRALADDTAQGLNSGQVDLTDAINGLGEPSLPPQEIARARAAERFGRSFRSERTVPQSRYVGEQEGLSDGDPSFGMFEHEISPGRFSTGASLDDLNRTGVPLPPGEYDDAGRLVAPPQAALDPSYAAHVISSRNKHAPVTVQDQERMRELVTQLFGENPSPAVSRMTAEQALLDDSTIGLTKKGKPIKAADVEDDNVLFGGASARQFGSGPEAGDFVRPKDRTPIGKRPNPPAWRFGREEALQWNR